MSQSDILIKILQRKVEENNERCLKVSMDELTRRAEAADKPRGFIQSMRNKITAGEAAVIAEIKKASPS
ncbi:MAG: indole-3-glycerol-phosphate synthase TrpC, partial [Gammaproteobacteria bacterium]|nr:indole-3-glycerol-phosphate synthase TrpC [Gammaproteobacteria bacterium]